MQQNLEKQFTPEQISAPNKQFPQRMFTLFKLAGQGTQGYVYLAQAQNWKYDNNKNLALKFSYKDQVQKNELNFLKYIMEYQESEFEQKVPCDMIKVLDIFDFNHNNQDYIVTVMEQGDTDLYKYLKINRTKLTEIQKIKICLDITNPIYFLHQKQMLHRDIKPENYIQVEGKFKLIDFGLIKQSNRVQTIGVGTPIFQAPEIVDNSQNYTDKVDVWALACVFYEIFNEESLFNYVDSQKIREKILDHKRNQNEVYQKINKINCDQQFKELMQNMLQPQVENRLDSSQVISCLQEIYNKMIKQQSLQIEEPQTPRLKTPYPPNIKQLNNNDSNINKSQSQVFSSEEQLIKQIKILEERTEKNQMKLENQLIKMLEEKEQKQLEIFKQIQQKQEKNEQNYQQQILTLNQKNEQLIQNHKQEINRLENQFNQDKTQQNQQISNLVNQINFLVQNQNEYLKKQEYQKLIENQKQEYLQQQKALQQNLYSQQTQITTANANFCNQLNSLKVERSSNQTFQYIPNTYDKEQVNLIIQNQLSESINKFQEQFNIEYNKKLQVMNDQIKLLNENQIPKNNLLSKNEEIDLKFGQLESTLQLFMNKTENNYQEQQKHIQNFQFQIYSLQQQNRAFVENSQANQVKVEYQMKQNVDLMNSKQQTDINNLKNAFQQEMKEQLIQEISQYFSKISNLQQQFDQFQFNIQYQNQKIDELKGILNTQLTFLRNQQNFNQFQLQSCKTQIEKLNQGIEQQLQKSYIEDLQTIKNQFIQELENVKDSLQLEIQNQNIALQENEFQNIKLNINQLENNNNLLQKTIEELKQQNEQQKKNIQLISQELHKYQQEPFIKQELNQPQNQLQNEQLYKIDQNLLLFQEQLRQQQEYQLQQMYTYINQSNNYFQQQLYQLINQYLSIQINENKENCEERCNKIKKDLQNNLKNQDSIIEELQQNLQNQLKDLNDLKKKERQIFKIIIEIIEEIPNFQSEKVDQLNEQIFGLLMQRQSTINLKGEKSCQNDQVNQFQIQIGLEQYEHQQSRYNNIKKQSLINVSGNIQQQIDENEGAFHKTDQNVDNVSQNYQNQSFEIDQFEKNDLILREMQTNTRFEQISLKQNDQLMNDLEISNCNKYTPNQFESDYNQKYYNSKQQNLSQINQTSNQSEPNIAMNFDQVQINACTQVHDTTQQKMDSQQEKEQKIIEQLDITNNQLNQEQYNLCQFQSEENLSQSENIQNVISNLQDLQQNNDQNIMYNSNGEDEKDNIY